MKERWVMMEPQLNVLQLFRLIEIAHEASNPELRDAALDLFRDATRSPIMIVNEDIVA